MESSIVIFILGIVVGAILTAKPDALRNMTPLAFGYTLFGLALVGSTLLLEWAGFACVVTAFVFYHAVGRAGWSNAIQSFFSFKWATGWRKKKAPSEAVQPSSWTPSEGPELIRQNPDEPRPSHEIVDDPIAKLDAAAEQDEALQTANASNNHRAEVK